MFAGRTSAYANATNLSNGEYISHLMAASRRNRLRNLTINKGAVNTLDICVKTQDNP